MLRLSAALVLSALAGAAAAQEGPERLLIGRDAYVAGQTATLAETGRDDVFLAGETVRLDAAAEGDVHAVGRWIGLRGQTGGDVYGLGQRVEISAPVAGDATLAGQEITLAAPVGGDLRVAGSEVALGGAVSGYAMVAAERFAMEGTVAGDMALTVRSAEFGPGARVAGTLTVYEPEPGFIAVPESVVPPERLTRVEVEEWEMQAPPVIGLVGWRGMAGDFVVGVAIVTALAALLAILAPKTMAQMRRDLLGAPGRAVLVGLVTQSALVGAGFVVALTVIGLLLTPGFWLLAGIAAFAGYVVGAYALGVRLLTALGRPEPSGAGDRALSAAAGALLAAVIALIPFLGWLFVLGLVLAGIGAIADRLVAPALFVRRPRAA